MILQLNAGYTVHKRHCGAAHEQIQANAECSVATWEGWNNEREHICTYAEKKLPFELFKMIDVYGLCVGLDRVWAY